MPESRVEKSGEHGEHAPRTPKVIFRNTQEQTLFEICLEHSFVEFQAIFSVYIYLTFPSIAFRNVI